MHTLSSILQVFFCKSCLAADGPSWLAEDEQVSLSTTEIESRFFLARFHPRGELLLTKKMAALSLSLTPCPLHFRFRSRDRDARCSDAYRAPCLFLCTLLISVSKRSSPLYFSARGWFLSRGERRRGAHFARYPFVPDEKIRMKHRALRSFIHKRGVSIRPEVVPILSSRGMRRFGSDLSRFPLKFRWFLEDAVIYGYICVCVCVIINKCTVAVTRIMLHLLILFV